MTNEVQALAVATGSLPVSLVEKIIKRWRQRAVDINDRANKKRELGAYAHAGRDRDYASMWEAAAEELRAEVDAANVRQPEENVPDEPRGK